MPISGVNAPTTQLRADFSKNRARFTFALKSPRTTSTCQKGCSQLNENRTIRIDEIYNWEKK